MKVKKFKRLLSIILCTILVFSCVPMSVSAYTSSVSYGDGFIYYHDTSTLSVSKSYAVTPGSHGANTYGLGGATCSPDVLALSSGVSISNYDFKLTNLGDFKGLQLDVYSSFDKNAWPSIGQVSTVNVRGKITGGDFTSSFLNPLMVTVESGAGITGGTFGGTVVLKSGSYITGGTFTGTVYVPDDSFDNNPALKDATIVKGVLTGVNATGDFKVGSTLTASAVISPPNPNAVVEYTWYYGNTQICTGNTCKIPTSASGKNIYLKADYGSFGSVQSVTSIVGTVEDINGTVDYKNECVNVIFDTNVVDTSNMFDVLYYGLEGAMNSIGPFYDDGSAIISVDCYTGKEVEYFVGLLTFSGSPVALSDVYSIKIPERPKYVGADSRTFSVKVNSDTRTVTVTPPYEGNYEYKAVILADDMDINSVPYGWYSTLATSSNGEIVIDDYYVSSLKENGNAFKIYVRNPSTDSAFGSEWQFVSEVKFCEHNNSEQKYVDNGDGTHSLIYTCCKEVKSTEEHSGGNATCTESEKCSKCSVYYGSKNPNNHSSNEVYYEFKDDKIHTVYHSCCNEVKETVEHTVSSPANCKDISYCDICKTSFGTTDLDNHTDSLVYIDLKNGKHIQKWKCCGDIEREVEKHNFVYTADNDTRTISASCPECGNKGSIELLPPSDLTYSGYSKEVTVTGAIAGVDKPAIIYKQGETELESAPVKVGTYTASITIGDATVEYEFAIAPKELTLEKLQLDIKVFDGTNNVSIRNAYLNGVVCYDEKEPLIEYDDVRDDVSIDISVLDVTLPNSVPGYYPTMPVNNIVLVGEDKDNYTIASSIDNVDIVDYYGHEFSVLYPTLHITAENQYLVGDQELDNTKCTVEGLAQGHIATGITLEVDEYDYINVNTDNLKITYNDQDVTEYYDVHTYSANLSWVCDDHDNMTEEGFCPNCNGYEVPKKVIGTDEYGNTIEYYEMKNAGNLYWYSQEANKFNQYVGAKLVNDINLNPGYTFNSDGTYTGGDSPREWIPIGNAKNYRPYCGNFDGNGYTISGLYINDPELEYAGMFDYTDYGNEIKNINISNSYIRGNGYVGALVASAGTYFYNCSVDETVTVVGNTNPIGGLIGYAAYGSVENCYSTATVIGDESAGIVGLSYAYIINSYTTNKNIAYVDLGSITNCYYLADESNDDGAKTKAQFESGEVAILLQGDQTEKVWGQTIGTDTYPTLGGLKVYKLTNCKDEVVYGNTYQKIHFPEAVEGKDATCKETGLTSGIKCSNCDEVILAQQEIPTNNKHNYENGSCTECGAKDPTEVPTEPSEPAGKTLYLKPNSNWTSGNARFAMYLTGKNGSEWVSMTEAENGYYIATLPSDEYTSVTFARMNGATTENNFANIWNKAEKQTIPTDSNCFTVDEGKWSGATGEWSVYKVVAPKTLYLKPNSNWTSGNARFAMYVTGKNGSEWVSMTEAENGYYTAVLPSNDYTEVTFARMNGATTENSFANIWNKAEKQTIPTNDNDCFTVDAGKWSGATGNWGVYATLTAPKVLYLKPNSNWISGNARFAMYLTGKNGSEWVSMTKAENGYYTAVLPSDDYTEVTFARMNGATTENSFANIWNKAEKQTISEDNNCFTVDEGKWSGATGVWSFYKPVAPKTLYLKPNSNWTKDNARFAMYLTGKNGSEWVSMTKAENGYYTAVLPSNDYTEVTFARMNGATTENSFANIWNKAEKQTIPTDDANAFVVDAGKWSGATGVWESL